MNEIGRSRGRARAKEKRLEKQRDRRDRLPRRRRPEPQGEARRARLERMPGSGLGRRQGAQAHDRAAFLVADCEASNAQAGERPVDARGLARKRREDRVAEGTERVASNLGRRGSEDLRGELPASGRAQALCRELAPARRDRRIAEEPAPAGDRFGGAVGVAREERLERRPGLSRRSARCAPARLFEPFAGGVLAVAPVGRRRGGPLPGLDGALHVPAVNAAVALLEPELADLEPVGGLLAQPPGLGIVARGIGEEPAPQRQPAPVMQGHEQARRVPVRAGAPGQRLDLDARFLPRGAIDEQLDPVSTGDADEIFASRGGGGLEGTAERGFAFVRAPRVVQRDREVEREGRALCGIRRGRSDRLLETHDGPSVLPPVEQAPGLLREEPCGEPVVRGAEGGRPDGVVNGRLLLETSGESEHARPRERGLDGLLGGQASRRRARPRRAARARSPYGLPARNPRRRDAAHAPIRRRARPDAGGATRPRDALPLRADPA